MNVLDNNGKYLISDKNFEKSEESKLISTEREFNETTYGRAYTNDIPLYKVINENAQ